jgi:hypothetical protein
LYLDLTREEHRPSVLWRMKGPKREEVTGGWKRLHEKELHSLYSSPNVIRMIKLRKKRRAGHEARMGTREMRTKF